MTTVDLVSPRTVPVPLSVPHDLHILETIEVACWLMDFNPENTRHIWCNSSCAQLLGKTKEEFLATDLTHGRTAARIQEQKMMYYKVQVLISTFKTHGFAQAIF